MDRRYKLMSTVSVRNLAGFNHKVREAVEKKQPLKHPFSLTPDSPEDLEELRGSVTVSSSLPCEWSEAQSFLEDLPMTGPEYSARLPRATDFNPGTIVRLRSLSEVDFMEFNEVRSAPGGGWYARS